MSTTRAEPSAEQDAKTLEAPQVTSYTASLCTFSLKSKTPFCMTITLLMETLMGYWQAQQHKHDACGCSQNTFRAELWGSQNIELSALPLYITNKACEVSERKRGGSTSMSQMEHVVSMLLVTILVVSCGAQSNDVSGTAAVCLLCKCAFHVKATLGTGTASSNMKSPNL